MLIRHCKENKKNYNFCCVNEGLVNHLGIHGLWSSEEKYDTDANFKL